MRDKQDRRDLTEQAREQWGHDVCVCGIEHRKRRFLFIEPGTLLDRVMSTVVNVEHDAEKAQASPYPYRAVAYRPPGWDFIAFEYHMTVLSVLHRWFGLTRVDAS